MRTYRFHPHSALTSCLSLPPNDLFHNVYRVQINTWRFLDPVKPAAGPTGPHLKAPGSARNRRPCGHPIPLDFRILKCVQLVESLWRVRIELTADIRARRTLIKKYSTTWARLPVYLFLQISEYVPQGSRGVRCVLAARSNVIIQGVDDFITVTRRFY